MEEIWKDIKGYEELYQVSNLGRVKSLSRFAYNHFTKERIMTPIITKKGYLQIRIRANCKAKGFKIHRLVAEAFIPNPNGLPQVNHIDGNKQNNCVDNLEWCTCKENMQHAVTHGLLHDYSGNKNPNCKVIFQYNLNGVFLKRWTSIYQITKELGYERHGISKCCSGKIKKYKNYIWKYGY